MSLFEGSVPDPVTLTKTSKAEQPEFLTNYQKTLAETGLGALGAFSADGKTFTPKTGEELIAPMSALQQQAYTDAKDGLTGYEDTFTKAQGALTEVPVTKEDIQAFYNPYESAVVDEMGRQSLMNVQRNLLPSLRAGFAGQGALGSSRYANVLGQSLADVQSNLLAQQAKARQSGYETALEAALKQAGYEVQSGQALTGLGKAEQEAAEEAYKTMANLGAEETAYEQAKLQAPLTQAKNVADLLRGYQFPLESEETAQSLPTVMGSSPLAQIAGLGTLVGAVDKSAGGGLLSKLFSGVGANVPTGYTSWNQYFDLNSVPGGETPIMG